MDEIINKTRSKIENFLKDSEEHNNKNIDCILVNPDTQETITIASDGAEEMIMFAPYTTKENGYEDGYMNVPEWDFNFDGYVFEELQKGYKVGFMSDDMHYGIWQSIEEYYPEEFDNKIGIQIYLKYCSDNNITKEYLDEKLQLNAVDIMKYYEGLEIGTIIEYKGYVIEVDDYNEDNEMENIVNIYESKQDHIDGNSTDCVSLNTIGLEQSIKEYIDETYINTNTVTISQWQYERDSESHYFAFVLGYDLLNDMIKKYDTLECDINYDFCNHIAEQFLQTEEYQNPKHSSYDMLCSWVNDNKEKIEAEYKDFIGYEEKVYNDGKFKIIDKGYRNDQPIALVERTFNDNSKEYIIAFYYRIDNDKLDWGYGYYYDKDISKAKQDYQKVINGGNLADTFERKEER